MTCNENLASEIDNFLDELEAIGGFNKGDFINEFPVITQINADNKYFFLKLIENIKDAFLPSQWATAFSLIIRDGLAVFCDEDKTYIGSVNAIIGLKE